MDRKILKSYIITTYFSEYISNYSGNRAHYLTFPKGPQGHLLLLSYVIKSLIEYIDLQLSYIESCIY